MSDDPAGVTSEYFSPMRAGDQSAVELFHDDAILVRPGTTRSGKDAIREFYQGVIERVGPTPRGGLDAIPIQHRDFVYRRFVRIPVEL